MFAIVDLNGQQVQIEAGRFVDVDLMDQTPDSVVTLDKVQLLVDEKGQTTIGTPYIDGAKVTAKVLSHQKARKIRVYKMRPKKGYRRTQGHRQRFTRLQIEAIAAS